MPLVSVIMPVYNGKRYLAEAIESILAQTFTDFEFIIIDDGSNDRSPQIALSYAEQDDRIRLIKLESNRGVADARNQGMAVASGEFIAVMDCDDHSLRSASKAKSISCGAILISAYLVPARRR